MIARFNLKRIKFWSPLAILLATLSPKFDEDTVVKHHDPRPAVGYNTGS